MARTLAMIDGNEAAASVAHALSEVIAIYPITPSTPMGEQADAWSAVGRPNIWGTVPQVIEMQSEGGAAGAIHGALQTGALATTFTASQGLLLMIPNMYKIAGELTPVVFHVAARAIATQALSIFGDHSDVMATRSTGFALLSSNSVQEAQDLALIAHASTLKARVPFLHFFDGFRTSHEINKVEQLTYDDLRAMIDEELVQAHRQRALSPEHPVIRGTSHNPDTYFQARETVNPFYLHCPEIVQEMMDRFAQVVGRQYHLFDYFGAEDAERVVVMMGSGYETAKSTAEYLLAKGEKVGVLSVHLYRPFSIGHFLQTLPATVKSIAVLDRTKEPGSLGEPLYQDVVTALAEGQRSGIRVIGGRYGISSKEFTPAMAKAVFDELKKEQPKSHFTVGIIDDVTNLSLDVDEGFEIDHKGTVQCVFWGLGSDGTVGANKNSIKIIGLETENYAQGYFVYDSKKSGSSTVSHLRFGPHPIEAPYLVEDGQADFVACHQFSFLERFDVLKFAKPGSIFLLDSLYGPDEVWEHLPRETQEELIAKHLRFYVIDAHHVASAIGMGNRINTIMQTCFFAISGILPRDVAIEQIKKSIKKTYGKRGEEVVQKNYKAVDAALEHMHEVKVPATLSESEERQARQPIPLPVITRRPPVPAEAPDFVRNVLGQMILTQGDKLPVSALPVDGTYPSGTACWEKRNLAQEIPVWNSDICIQCGKCVMVCPHAVIRQKVYEPAKLEGAPETFKSTTARYREFPNTKYTLQVSPEDCTGCALCIEACPVKDKKEPGRKAINMEAQPPLREQESKNWDFFLQLPEVDRNKINVGAIKNAELLTPLFEFSGACSGCGETPYIKLATQLFGDRMVVANATGCSSIYGGNLPTTPWTKNADGRGPAWANSLFEDNAEFGLGMRVNLDKQHEHALELVQHLRSLIGEELATALLENEQADEYSIQQQRERVAVLRERLQGTEVADAAQAAQVRDLLSLADHLVKHSVWIIGGDGWAYDIGFGGLDHVLATGRNVNVLVLDTEVYSNTGGQASKSTPRGAVAKFAAHGKTTAKKDLGLYAMSYGNVYVAHVALGANDQQTLKAFLEAEAYDGPSLIIAYSHCIAHGYDLRNGLNQQKAAVQTGYWPLYRYNPLMMEQGKNPLTLDSKAPSLPLETFAYKETRFKMLMQMSDKEEAERLMTRSQHDIEERWHTYDHLAKDAAPEVSKN